LSDADDKTAKEFLAYCENVRKILKSASTNLKSVDHLLQETLENWKTYHSLFDQLEKWLAEGEQILLRSAEEKLVTFRSLSKDPFSLSRSKLIEIA
jgi:hypothetical protein